MSTNAKHKLLSGLIIYQTLDLEFLFPWKLSVSGHCQAKVLSITNKMRLIKQSIFTVTYL